MSGVAHSPRTLVIGLDVGDGRLLREWAQRGHLPVLASLIERGAWTWLETTADTLHVSAWPSIYTGCPPGEHGVYYTFQAAPGQQGYAKFDAGQYGRPSFWSLLSGAGVRCTIFDAPYTHPESDSAAAQVFEWGTWAHHWRPMSTPSPLFRRLKRECGRYPLGIEALDVGLGPLDADDMRRRLVDSVRAKSRAAAWLMGEAHWDLFFVVYGETHPGAHYLWPSSGADAGASTGGGRAGGRASAGRSGATPMASSGSASVDGDDPHARLRSVYQELDRGIGTLLQRAGEDVSVYVVSGDGVGPNRGGWHLLPEVLRRLGYLAEPSEGDARPAGPGHTGTPPTDGAPAESAGTEPAQRLPTPGTPEPIERPRAPTRDPIRMLRDALPRDFRKALARKLPAALRHRLARRVDTAAIDWSRTRAFCLPTDLEGYIRVNLLGREPQGIVSPGAEYRAVCEELDASLRALVDPDTGQPAVREVVHADEMFAGPRRQHLPDLVVLWNAERPLTALCSPEIGTVTGASPDARPGTHVSPGFLLCCGPDVPASSVATGGHVCQVASMLLTRFGLRVPDYMMGSHPATAESSRSDRETGG